MRQDDTTGNSTVVKGSKKSDPMPASNGSWVRPYVPVPRNRVYGGGWPLGHPQQSYNPSAPAWAPVYAPKSQKSGYPTTAVPSSHDEQVYTRVDLPEFYTQQETVSTDTQPHMAAGTETIDPASQQTEIDTASDRSDSTNEQPDIDAGTRTVGSAIEQANTEAGIEAIDFATRVP